MAGVPKSQAGLLLEHSRDSEKAYDYVTNLLTSTPHLGINQPQQRLSIREHQRAVGS